MGGSWFNKDNILSGVLGLTIEKNSVMSKGKQIQVPYSKVKKITFEEGEYINTMTIEIDGGSVLWGGTKENFSIRSKSAFETVKFFVYSKQFDVTIVEEKSFLKSLLGKGRKEQPKWMKNTG